MNANPRYVLLSVVAALAIYCSDHEPAPADSAAARAKISAEASARRASQALQAAVANKPLPPEPPKVPRTTIEVVEVPSFPRVYVDNERMLAHRQACKERTSKMLRLPLAIAKTQGYALHWACEKLKDGPEYHKKPVVHPDWIAYEAELARYNQTILTFSPPSDVSPGASPAFVHSTGNSSVGPSGEVRVKGYYRKDGSYVPPHTRSKPKRR